MRVSQTKEKRLRELEKRFKPSPNWVITAKFETGRIKRMSAREYAKVKMKNPKGVQVIDRKITGNVEELKAYLDLTRDLAFLYDDSNEEELLSI